VPADVKEYPDARHGFINRLSLAGVTCWPMAPPVAPKTVTFIW
jgi:hypothetical protein